MLSFFITTPLIVLMILNLPFRSLMKRIVFVVGLSLALIQAVLVALAIFGFWDIYSIPVSPMLRFNIGVDNLSLLLLLCNGMVVFITMLVSRSFIEEGEKRFNFTSLLLLSFAGVNGIALARDIFSLYVFIEVVSISSFILICFNKDRDAFEGAFKYIILSAIATIFMLTSIALIFLVSGDMSFEAVRAALDNSAHTSLVLMAIGLFLCGFFIKAGVVPFHGWLADAYTSASAPVSVYLAGVSTKAVGVYALIRIVVTVFGFDTPINKVLLFAGALSVVVGAIATLTQTDFKRMLAYSSISQIGYIVLALGIATPLGIAAAAFHFFNHAVFKSLLFVNAATLEIATGTREMDKLGGLAQRMPVTGVTSALACLSIAGVPPLAGFWSKLLIIIALWSSAHYNYALIAALASLLTLGYMLLLQRKVFFGSVGDHLARIKEGEWNLIICAIILAAVTVGVGVLFPFNLCKLIIR
ncbi:MAG: proton-conducting transporter membrane subunit [Candidatus Omnitrophica bacterium]|nr:proton-conducting transporter membrane subunit [Candidatus Omnitrophota bacterium]